jgi:hypothetical protein
MAVELGERASALGGIRTPNLLIRSQMLYPLSYERWSSVVYNAILPTTWLATNPHSLARASGSLPGTLHCRTSKDRALRVRAARLAWGSARLVIGMAPLHSGQRGRPLPVCRGWPPQPAAVASVLFLHPTLLASTLDCQRAWAGSSWAGDAAAEPNRLAALAGRELEHGRAGIRDGHSRLARLPL